MPFFTVAKVSQVADSGTVVEIATRGEPVALCNVDGAIFAMRGICPHQGGPLGQGTLHGRTLTCPWHGWEFDCQTGANVFDEAVKVPVYKVRVEGEDIQVEIPGAES